MFNKFRKQKRDLLGSLERFAVAMEACKDQKHCDVFFVHFSRYYPYPRTPEARVTGKLRIDK
jgi:hypothetical protein